MKEIKGYKLTNGQIVESKSEAIRLQKKIDFEKAIWTIVEREIISNDNINLVGNFLIENVDELHKIFNAR